jgi:endogenous inhibitor of DNA gyrase (YacG/DUF329 family)
VGRPCDVCGVATSNPKYCSRSCAAKANNVKFPKRTSKYEPRSCPICHTSLTTQQRGQNRTYCSNKCARRSEYQRNVELWLAGSAHGGISAHKPSSIIKKWLRETRGDKCEQCGWNVRHPITGEVPIELDHEDGDYRNNHPDNLRLLCPNCHSLTPTYRGRNRGKGRPWRRHGSLTEMD